jgi:hypothetical protein
MRMRPHMKAIVFLLFGVLTFTGNTVAQVVRHDLRVVNGITVDLDPVHKWLLDHKGERPLKHWKELVIMEIGSKLGDFERCLVSGANSNGVQEVLIANMPKETRESVLADQQRAQQRAQALLALRRQVAAGEQAREGLWDRYVYSEGWATTVTAGTGGVSSSSDNDATRLATARSADNNLRMMREQLAQMQNDSGLYSFSNRIVLAMFSGRKSEKLEIWDCGKPSR